MNKKNKRKSDMKDIYIENISAVSVRSGVVTVSCGVGSDEAGEETVRLRIPLSRYQTFAGRIREGLLGAMRDGWFGEDGVKAAAGIDGKEAGR